jgi:protein-tyrosine phosphatase
MTIKITWIIKNELAHSRLPYASELDFLYRRGIKAIVSLVHSPDLYKLHIKEKFEYLEVDVKDFAAPTIDQLIRINKFIDSMINKKKPVLVHCIAGGRSGTVLVSYLIYHGKSFSDSLSEVRGKIKDVRAVESHPQEEILKKFEMYVREK